MSLTPGSRIGPYQILSAIGTGGMGEVYRARDTRLRRDVAIKTVSADFALDPDRLARFEREAQVLASLNHPHIGAIYGFEELSGSRFLILELVEGETLGDRIARGSIAQTEALGIARQIADALDAAHERGVVHRDLKPANVKITPDGVVKVLDFGLARADGDPHAPGLTHSPTMTVGTRDGVILGTAAYMSPEQARGRVVDKRADIWALGCVLFEMLTGRAAFGRDTLSDTLVAVLEREPDWSALPAVTAPTTRRLLRRCLEKDLKRRLRDVGDARNEIDEVLSPATVMPAAVSDSPVTTRPRVSVVAVAAVALTALVAALAVWLVSRRAGAPVVRDPLGDVVAIRLTDYGGTEAYGALAPDGRSFVFVSDHGGASDIWRRQVAGGEPVRLTDDALAESELAYAPDGDAVYFTRTGPVGQAIWRVGALGGEERKLIENATMPLPSPNGRKLAFYGPDPDNTAEWALFVSTIDGEGRQAVARHIINGASRAAWSRDGRMLSYSRAALFGPCNLLVIDVATGRERQITHFARANEGLSRGTANSSQAWLPDNRHLVVSYQPSPRQQAPDDLGILDIEDGAIRRVTVAVSDAFAHASLSADGSRLVAEMGRPLREIWNVPSAASTSPGRSPVRLFDKGLPFWTFVSRDARFVLFSGTLSGNRHLWLMRVGEDALPKQITTQPGDVVSHSALSPDGIRVAFASTASGDSHIWTQNVDGTGLRQLTQGSSSDSWPVWSPDGKWIAYSSDPGSGAARQVWRIPIEGGTPETIAAGFGRGDWATVDQRNLMVASNGASEIRLIDVDRRTVVWAKNVVGSGLALPIFSTDGHSISVPFRESRDHDGIYVLDTLSGTTKWKVSLPFRVAFRAAWADDGASFIVNRTDTVSHIVMLDRFWTGVATR